MVAVTEAKAGAVLARDKNPDEYMLLLPPDMPATIKAGAETVEAQGDSLTILPPGASSITVKAGGTVARVFSNTVDLAARCSNAAIYADGAPEVTPTVPWPAPKGGFKLRHYPLEPYLDPKIFGRIFRSTNLMINVLEPKTTRRSPRQMSPHSHEDFEQCSLTLAGKFIHHLRTPWTPDMETWREDEHLTFESPSVLVIPANLIHTTQDVGEGVTWLIDIFGPPRRDFSLKPGWVRNAGEYPMPA